MTDDLDVPLVTSLHRSIFTPRLCCYLTFSPHLHFSVMFHRVSLTHPFLLQNLLSSGPPLSPTLCVIPSVPLQAHFWGSSLLSGKYSPGNAGVKS